MIFLAYGVLKEIRSGYHGGQTQVKQVILQCAAAVAAHVFRIQLSSPLFAIWI